MGKKPKTFKNPRRQALAMLKDLRDGVSWLSSGWNVRSTAYDMITKTYRDQRSGEVREYQDHATRPRRYEEYPENNKENWAALYAEADRLVALASALREFAETEYHRTVNRDAGRASQQ